MQSNTNPPITAIIVGAGHRALLYSQYALLHPDRLKIVGVADPNEFRQKETAKMHNFNSNMCFSSAQDLATQPKLADAIINGTMDEQHIPTSVPLLEKGYDMLLEKPFAINENEMWHLLETSQRNNNTVMICHVLRYAPFYKAIRQRIIDKVIGDIINIQCTEHVSYHHLAVSFVRGKWGNEEACHTSMLLAKCCHDMDLIMWLQSGIHPKSITSFGSDFQFDEAKKPKNSGTRCLVDCPIEPTCLYSAKKHYIDHPDRWSFYVWDAIEHLKNPTIEDKITSLKTDNIHGRCVWKCNHTVVDHQSVVINFENGSTATLNMIGGTSKAERSIHIIGTKGEIKGVFDESKFTLRLIDPRPGHEYIEEVFCIGEDGDFSGVSGTHGGGDLKLVEDFVSILEGNKPSISATSIEDSISGHLAIFKAEEARKNNCVVNFHKEN